MSLWDCSLLFSNDHGDSGRFPRQTPNPSWGRASWGTTAISQSQEDHGKNSPKSYLQTQEWQEDD